MFSLVCDPREIADQVTVEVDVEADGPGPAAGRLAQRAALPSSRRASCCSPSSRSSSWTSTHLRARVTGEPLDPDRHIMCGGVKAATLHELVARASATTAGRASSSWTSRRRAGPRARSAPGAAAHVASSKMAPSSTSPTPTRSRPRRACACPGASTRTRACSSRPATRRRCSRSPTSPRCRASWRPASRCRTSTGATASPSAASPPWTRADGVVSPGGVGFDINCGVRLVRTGLAIEDVRPRLEPLMHELMRRVPQGAGPHGALRLEEGELERLAEEGAAVPREARAWPRTTTWRTRRRAACMPGADAAAVSHRALERGRTQVGSLGSGNHFLEVQVVDEVLDERAASAFGVAPGQVVVMIHSGSRGFGHQICTDHVARMASVAARAGIELPDRQLACAPLGSPEAREYLAAMACACNFAFANRQMMLHEVRGAFEQVFRAAGSGSAWSSSTTWRTTSPSARCTWWTATSAPCACTARARRAPSAPAAPTSRRTTATSASRSSSPATWAPRAGCWPARRRRCARPSARPATGRAACSPGTRPARSRAAPRCGASWRTPASS